MQASCFLLLLYLVHVGSLAHSEFFIQLPGPHANTLWTLQVRFTNLFVFLNPIKLTVTINSHNAFKKK